jgi:hypothetical protein
MEKETMHRESFIIRIWRQEGNPGWRGWVQHVRSGESGLVQSREELLAFVEGRTGRLDGSPRKGLR